MKFRYITMIIAAISMIMLSGCGNNDIGRRLAVSLPPQQYLLESLCGERFEVVCLLSEGSNPETFEPTMQQMVELERCKAYFAVGQLSFEKSMTDRLQSNNAAMRMVDCSEGMDLLHGSHHGICGESDEHEHHHHHHHDVDPHIWTSVKNAHIMAIQMHDVLVDLDPEGAAYYDARMEALEASLDSLDMALRTMLTPMHGKAFAVWHPSLGYFARDYGLHQIAMEYEGKEMPAQYMKAAVDTVKSTAVEVMLYQKEFDSRQVRTLSREMGVSLREVNLLGYDWHEEMLRIGRAIAAGKEPTDE